MSDDENNATAPEAPQKVLLIDLENCPNQINQLMRNLEQFSQVIICYAQSGAKIPIDWIIPLTSTINSKKLQIIKMPSNGKNSADFGITFWAGALMQQLPPQTHFTVVSEDVDLDHVVKLLLAQGRRAERINAKKDDKPIVATPSTSAVNRYCAYLIKHSKNRPVKRETLINHINSGYKDEAIDSDLLIHELTVRGAISVEGGRIVYHESVISRLAGS